MGTYRRIDVRVWNDPKFAALPMLGKLVFLHAFASAHGNVSGVYVWNAQRVAREIGCTADEALAEMRSSAMIELVLYDEDEGLIFVRSMYKIQGGGPKLDRCALSYVEALPASSPSVRAFAERYPDVGVEVYSTPAKPLKVEPQKDYHATAGYPIPKTQEYPIPEFAGGEGEGEGTVEGEGEGEGVGETADLPVVSGLSALPAVAGHTTPTPESLAVLWGRHCPDLPQVRLPLTGGIAKRLRDAIRRERGRDWGETFRVVGESPMLTGRKAFGDGGTFRADLLWALSADKLAGIDAGRYEARDGPTAPARTQRNRGAIVAGAERAAARMRGES